MQVNLVSITKPVDGTMCAAAAGGMDAEDLIAYCARVSNPNNQNNKATAPKPIKVLNKT